MAKKSGDYIVYSYDTGKMVGDLRHVTAESAVDLSITLTKSSGELHMVCKKAEYEAGTHPVKMVERVNLMSGKTFQERVDRPYYLSPSSETYWSS